MNQRRTRPRRAAVGGLAAATLLVATGCTADSESPEESAPTPLPSRSVEAGPTLEAKPVPMEVEVAKVVGGKLRAKQRRSLEQRVARVVSQYFDAAYLAGEYPRRNFSDALDRFSAGAAQRALPDRDLLTNAAIGTTTEAVVPRAKRLRLDVLQPGRVVVGLTARFRLAFVQERTRGTDRRVTVAGRLLMNRKKSGAWQIFGYDVTRSSVPVAKGARR